MWWGYGKVDMQIFYDQIRQPEREIDVLNMFINIYIIYI